MSRKILDLARDQQEEIAKEVGKSWAEEDDEDEQQGEPYVYLLLLRGWNVTLMPKRSRRPRQVIDTSDEEEGGDEDEGGEYSGGEDLNAEFVSLHYAHSRLQGMDRAKIRTSTQRITLRLIHLLWGLKLDLDHARLPISSLTR
jgi:essential nuclear protein 1